MAFFKVVIELVDGRFDYDVPDVHLISGAKYEWIPANLGNPSLPQGTCFFEYPINLGNNIPRRESITQPTYDSFAVVSVSPTEATIIANNADGVEITDNFPSAGGIAYFKVTFADGTSEVTEIPIGSGGIAKLPEEKTYTSVPGQIIVTVKSDIWHDVEGFDKTIIEAT